VGAYKEQPVLCEFSPEGEQIKSCELQRGKLSGKK